MEYLMVFLSRLLRVWDHEAMLNDAGEEKCTQLNLMIFKWKRSKSDANVAINHFLIAFHSINGIIISNATFLVTLNWVLKKCKICWIYIFLCNECILD